MIAAVGLVGGAIFSCTMQPYLEVFTRWNHVKMELGDEMKPPERVNRIAKSVSCALIIY